MDSEQIYASVDLELSGFDPDEDEIIEIGIVTFTVRKGILVVLEKYQSLCRPKSDVRNRILGLTGIDQAEVMSAPPWSEVLPKVKELLSGAIIVGHGVSMDSKFLEANGVSVSGAVLDTLELAQIFLPTHHSYNLENLATTLNVAHGSSHRALADAEATFGILDKMAQIFQSLSVETKERLRAVAIVHQLLWFNLFSSLIKLEDIVLDKQSAHTGSRLIADLPDAFESNSLIIGPGPDTEVVPNFAQLSTFAVPYVVAYNQRNEVLNLAKEFGVNPYLGAFEQVREQVLENLIENALELNSREVVALCKVLVWRGSVKGFGLLAELNWSIIGTDLKKLFVAGYTSKAPDGLALADLRSVPDFTGKRNLWISQLDACVDFLEQKSGMQVSWAGIGSQIRALTKDKDGVSGYLNEEQASTMMAITDVFFARILLLLKQELQLVSGSVALKDLGLYEIIRISQSALNFCERMLKVIKQSGGDTGLTRVVEQIRRFFGPDGGDEFIRWIEVGDAKCTFVMRAVNLSDAFHTWSNGKQQIVYQVDFNNSELIAYFTKRLGLGPIAQRVLPKPAEIQVLNYLTVVKPNISDYLASTLAEREDCLVVFPNLDKLKAFYDAVVGKANLTASVIAVGIHGGAQKVLRNFSHSKKTVILATVSQLASFYGDKLACKSLIFAGMPTLDVQHPYNFELISKYFNGNREDFERVNRLLLTIQVLRSLNIANVDILECVVPAEEANLATNMLESVFMNNLSTV